MKYSRTLTLVGVISLFVAAIPAGAAGQGRGKIIDVRPPKPPTPATLDFPDTLVGTFDVVNEQRGGNVGGAGVVRWEVYGRALTWVPKFTEADELADLPVKGVQTREYVLDAHGVPEIEVKFSGHSTGLHGTCTIEGSHTFSLTDFPPAALDRTKLRLFGDGRYEITIDIRETYLDIKNDIKSNCPISPNSPFKIRLGLIGQKGTMVYRRVQGSTPEPWRASWDFGDPHPVR